MAHLRMLWAPRAGIDVPWPQAAFEASGALRKVIMLDLCFNDIPNLGNALPGVAGAPLAAFPGAGAGFATVEPARFCFGGDDGAQCGNTTVANNPACRSLSGEQQEAFCAGGGDEAETCEECGDDDTCTAQSFGGGAPGTGGPASDPPPTTGGGGCPSDPQDKAAAGGTCTQPCDCESDACDSGVCAASGGGDGASPTPPPAPSPCPNQDDKKTDGATCTQHCDCVSDTCTNGQCASSGSGSTAIGQPCGTPTECTSGVCDVNVPKKCIAAGGSNGCSGHCASCVQPSDCCNGLGCAPSPTPRSCQPIPGPTPCARRAEEGGPSPAPFQIAQLNKI